MFKVCLISTIGGFSSLCCAAFNFLYMKTKRQTNKQMLMFITYSENV